VNIEQTGSGHIESDEEQPLEFDSGLNTDIGWYRYFN
jgi:hypothetical protein